MATVRPAAAAGSFYPEDPEDLQAEVTALLAAAPRHPLDLQPQMFVVPHAGYIYSGPVAAVAYRMVQEAPDSGGRFVLLGPSHFVEFPGLASPGSAVLATPLGQVLVDEELVALAETHDRVNPEPAAHYPEHSLEVQLPFLQVARGKFTALPITTGDVDPTEVADVLDELLEIPGVISIISSDLSHYYRYEEAQRRDARTAAAITALDANRIDPGNACGRTAVQAALLLARRRGWSCRQLALQNSADTVGSRRRVVGYGAFAIGPAP